MSGEVCLWVHEGYLSTMSSYREMNELALASVPNPIHECTSFMTSPPLKGSVYLLRLQIPTIILLLLLLFSKTAFLCV